MAKLRKWELEVSPAATGSPPLTRMTLDYGPLAIVGGPSDVVDAALMYAPHRTILDHMLLNAARETGPCLSV